MQIIVRNLKEINLIFKIQKNEIVNDGCLKDEKSSPEKLAVHFSYLHAFS